MSTLGKLDKIELRDQWKDEARDFTPWLAQEENLHELSNAIGIDLELENTEVYVGSFKADIVARDINSDRRVIIENQLEKSNHDHLGKTITYASGVEASVIIWIASKIRDEHQQAVDWLNENTNESFGFFALEMELWKIGDSLPAPKFNIVSKPNGWAKTVKEYSRNSTHTSTQALQLDFWTAFVEYCDSVGTTLSLRSPGPRHWYSIAVGRSNFEISLILNSFEGTIRVELYIRGKDAKKNFQQLEAHKQTIESELGCPVEWKELPDQQDSRIVLAKEANYQDREDWESQHSWLKKWAENFHKVFSPIIKKI
jgi:hypothetical protein